MTLVLPFGGDQISNSNLFLRPGSNQNSSMPCVFENDAFEGDFESALMRDWASEINDYEMSSGDSSIKAPSEVNDLKRKSPVDSDEVPNMQSKKPRLENNVVPSIPSGLTLSSSSSSEDHCSDEPSSVSSSFLESSLDAHSTSTSSSSSSSSSSEGDASAEADDDDYMPRRRGIQMWNSRQRWKDERKKVMKMSVTKLAEIDDPELCLLRSVLINNTIKKLHGDIRNERQAKLRHRQQRMDFFAERFPPLASSNEHLDFNDEPETTKPSSDFYDDSSCDEMFGISEDFLRVTIPDRRVSSPIPTIRDSEVDVLSSDRETSMEGVTSTTSPVTSASVSCSMSCYANSALLSCDTAVDCSSPFCQRRGSPSSSSQTVTSTTPAFPSSPPMRRLPPPPAAVGGGGGGQCATQYRTNRDLGDVSFPPRVPILDSVVYHSLLASLESS